MVMVVLGLLQEVLGLQEVMILIGQTSSEMTSRCWSFFFSSLFGALCQRGRKLEGSTTFLTPWRLLQLESCLYPFRVVFIRWQVESPLKTLNCEIMLLFDSLCGIWTYINLWYRLWYNCARMYIFICITCCVVSVLIYAVTASVAVPHPAATSNHVVHKLSFALPFTYLT